MYRAFARAIQRFAAAHSFGPSGHSWMLQRHNNKPRHGMCQGKQNLRRAHPMLPRSRCARGMLPLCNHKRLSATDISAHASMKNVAKCDTWCELQNPVNHRVFERKLRPKPFGRGHVCLGVTHRVAPASHPLLRHVIRERRLDSRAHGAAVRNKSPLRWTHDKWWSSKPLSFVVRRKSRVRYCSRTQRVVFGRRFDCDPRSGGTTR